MTPDGAGPPEDFEQTKTSAGGPTSPEPRPAPLPAAIGPYRILGLLGEGGMGVVYEAEQASPRRVVALKVVRGGQFVDEERVRMFQREAETLARLKHPNIAGIFESGRTDDGQHFFAMELVRGPMLHEHFGRTPVKTRADLVARLELFRTICDAVQYAHQRGVIHRDLKPSNIVVTDEAGRPAVKILDFGLARITESDLAAASRVTEIGVIKGTLAYMSPEQALGNPEEIDARADVYSLGVMLYELLVGKRPHVFENTSIVDAVRVITSEPPPPLRRHSGAAMRLDSDLETIAGKALEKEPDRRYATAAALSDDVGRYLASQPILARPPSTMYQLRKAISRNRLASALAGVLALSMVAFGVWMSVLYQRAGRERTEARRQAQIAVAVNEFLNHDLLAAVDPNTNSNREITMRQVVDLASAHIKGRFTDEPLVGAAIHRTLGQTYIGLGAFDQAEPHLREALAIYVKDSGEKDPETLRTASMLGNLDLNKGKFDDALARLKATAEEQRRRLGDAHQDTLVTLDSLAVVYYNQGRLDESGTLCRQIVEAARRGIGEEADPAMSALNTLGMVETDLHRFDDAEKTYKHVLALQRKKGLGEDTIPLLTTVNNLSQVYVEAGRFEDAEPISRDLLERARRVLGSEHNETLTYVNNLAIIDRKLGKNDEAERLYREAYEVSRRTLGAEAPSTLVSMVNLGSFYTSSDRCAPNVGFIDLTVDLCRKHMPPDVPALGLALRNQGGCLSKMGHPREAEPLLVEAESRLAKLFGAADPKVIGLNRTLADLYDKLGSPEKAAERRARVQSQAAKEPGKP